LALKLYSVRFFAVTTTNTWFHYTVPAGKRAVIRSAACIGSGLAACTFAALIGPCSFLYVVVPAASGSFYAEMRQVANAGDDISCNAFTAGSNLMISGYLFTDTGYAVEDPPAAIAGPPPEGWLEVSQRPQLLNAPVSYPRE